MTLISLNREEKKRVREEKRREEKSKRREGRESREDLKQMQIPSGQVRLTDRMRSINHESSKF